MHRYDTPYFGKSEAEYNKLRDIYFPPFYGMHPYESSWKIQQIMFQYMMGETEWQDNNAIAAFLRYGNVCDNYNMATNHPDTDKLRLVPGDFYEYEVQQGCRHAKKHQLIERFVGFNPFVLIGIVLCLILYWLIPSWHKAMVILFLFLLGLLGFMNILSWISLPIDMLLIVPRRIARGFKKAMTHKYVGILLIPFYVLAGILKGILCHVFYPEASYLDRLDAYRKDPTYEDFVMDKITYRYKWLQKNIEQFAQTYEKDRLGSYYKGLFLTTSGRWKISDAQKALARKAIFEENETLAKYVTSTENEADHAQRKLDHKKRNHELLDKIDHFMMDFSTPPEDIYWLFDYYETYYNETLPERERLYNQMQNEIDEMKSDSNFYKTRLHAEMLIYLDKHGYTPAVRPRK